MAARELAINTAKQFVKDCGDSGLNFYKVLLFGSYAKDKADEWSDIDLLLVSDQFGNNVFENLKLYSKINIKYPIIETHPYPISNYINGDEFISEISRDGIEIV